MKRISENGYSVVVVPIILGVLLLLMAFIFEYGRYVTIKHQLQSAVDSAVLAGVSMCRVEYKNIEDILEDGTIKLEDNTKVVLVEDKAIEEAKNYFKKNRESLKLDPQNVKILNDNINIKVEDNTLQMEIKADIKGIFATALFGKDNELAISVRAKAEPIDV